MCLGVPAYVRWNTRTDKLGDEGRSHPIDADAPPNPDRRRLFAFGAAALWIGAGVGYLALEATAAVGFRTHYSYARNYISDLGVTSAGMLHGRMVESPLAHLMNAAFYLQGISFLAGAVLMVCALGRRKSGLFLALAATNAVGNVLVGTIHSGHGADGIAWLHAVGAVMAITGGNIAIPAGSALLRDAGASQRYRAVSLGIAGVGLLGFTIFAIDSTIAGSGVLPNGVSERAAVYSIIAWQMLTAGYLIRR